MNGQSLWALLPDVLLQDSNTLQERTALVVNEAGEIVAIAAEEDLPIGIEVVRFADEWWTAAPVMAHAHLESFDAPSAAWAGSGFSAWVEQLLTWRQRPDRLTPSSSAALSLAELARCGCGLVATHVAEPGADASARSAAVPQVLAMQEVFAPAREDFDRNLLQQLALGQALALHAPFSIADEVATAVFKAAQGGLISIHLGEHDEERELLACGEGALAQLLRARGRALKKRRFASPVDWLQSVGGLRKGTLVVHGGDLNSLELQRLTNANVGVVFCPGTHHYFARPQPAFVAAATPLPALGCDSRASNSSLDPLRELALAFAMMPDGGAEPWWHALTTQGAAVLQQQKWGTIRVGKIATLLRLFVSHAPQPTLNAKNLCTALCEGWRPPLQVSAFPQALPTSF